MAKHTHNIRINQKARIYLSEVSQEEKKILQMAALESGFQNLSTWIMHVIRQEVKRQARRKGNA